MILRPGASGGSRDQDAYFGVRVYFSQMSPVAATREARIQSLSYRDIEHGVFTPLVFTSTGSILNFCLVHSLILN